MCYWKHSAMQRPRGTTILRGLESIQSFSSTRRRVIPFKVAVLTTISWNVHELLRNHSRNAITTSFTSCCGRVRANSMVCRMSRRRMPTPGMVRLFLVSTMLKTSASSVTPWPRLALMMPPGSTSSLLSQLWCTLATSSSLVARMCPRSAQTPLQHLKTHVPCLTSSQQALPERSRQTSSSLHVALPSRRRSALRARGLNETQWQRQFTPAYLTT
mmetsp:Transcript_18210/g.50302  ORF Transcript_18210/g.50302 Transcript_18210/m.50302 type:complete len:215 (-) Transcript_18210:2174-2818(-)